MEKIKLNYLILAFLILIAFKSNFMKEKKGIIDSKSLSIHELILKDGIFYRRGALRPYTGKVSYGEDKITILNIKEGLLNGDEVIIDLEGKIIKAEKYIKGKKVVK